MSCSESDYDYLRHLVHEGSANRIDPGRNGLFDAKLKPIARNAGASNLEEFVNILRVDQSPHLHRAVAEAMTINETSFFRDRMMFDALGKSILPRLIEANAGRRRLRIWSAACSTGQEAYSVAMLICEEFPALANWDVKVTGTDISPQMVNYARRGRFRRMEVNRGLAARLLVKYFERDGEEWEIARRLRSMCEFQCVNLCGLLPFCRFSIWCCCAMCCCTSLPWTGAACYAACISIWGAAGTWCWELRSRRRIRRRFSGRSFLGSLISTGL